MMKSTYLVLLVMVTFLATSRATEEEVGNIPTQITVEQGQAKLRVPIPLPNQFGYGILSELVLSYDSAADNGVAGYGWNIDGISSISRCRQTFAQDGKVLGVSYTESDRFCLDGARLVNISGRYGNDKTIYNTEVDSYRRIKSFGSKGSGPIYFTVESNDRVMVYGKSGDSSYFGENQNSKFEWLLTSISDYTLAKVEFTYLTGKNYPYLTTVSSGGMTVKFNYEPRNDVRTTYHNGKILTEMTMRLKTIQTYVGKTMHREMSLSYIVARANKLSILNSIGVCNGKSRCLKPVTLDYKGLEDIKLSTDPIYGIKEFGTGWSANHPRFVQDVNDDGLADVIGFANGGVFVSLNEGDGKFLPGKLWLNEFGYSAGGWRIGSNIRNVIDVNGDGLPDIIGFSSSGVHVALNTGKGSFSPSSQWVDGYGYSAGWRNNMHPRFVKDVNGDGLPDIIGFFNTEIFVSLNTGSAFAPRKIWLSKEFCWSAGGWRGENPRFLEDVNGDGLPDIVGFSSGGVSVGLNTGHSFSPGVLWIPGFGYSAGGWRVASHPRLVTDVNGDGLADVVGFSCCGVEVALSTGKSFQKSRTWLAYFALKGGWSVSQHPRFVQDMNNDGLKDIVGFASDGVYVSLNTGNSFQPAIRWIKQFGQTNGWRIGTHPRMLVDVSGDGLPDIVGFSSAGLYISFNENIVTALVTITDSLKVVDEIEYSTHADKNVYLSAISTNSYPVINYNGALHLVKRISSENGIGGKNATTFRYGPLRVDMKGRGRLSYEWIEAAQLQNNEINTDFFNYEYPLTGTLREYIRKIKGNMITHKQQEFIHHKHKRSLPVIQVQLLNTSEIFSELDGTVIKEVITEYNDIDIYGNTRHMRKSINGGGKTFIQETVKSYHNSPSSWFIGRLRSLKVTHVDDTGIKITRNTEFIYDEDSRKLLCTVIEPDDHHSQLTNYTYDAYGNLLRQSQQAKYPHGSMGKQMRRLTMEYDKLGVRKLSTTNDLGHKESYTYDDLGNTVSLTGANGLKTSWSYDQLDRKVSETRPDGTKISWDYTEDVSLPNAAYRVIKTETGKPSVIEVFDRLERLIRIIKKGFKGVTIHEDIFYNDLGQIKKQSVPYKVTSRPTWTEFTYDEIGREILVDKPFNDQMRRVSRKVFNGLITELHDAKGHKTINERDVMERMVAVTDAKGGTVRYKYNPIGNLVKITDQAGNVREFTYDKVGNKIQIKDPDMGIWKYGYNAFGELIRQIDAKNNERVEVFDSLGRIIQRQESEGKTEWFYDNGTHAIGKLTQVKGPEGFRREFVYDKYGRIITVKTTVGPGSVFEVKTVYNKQGQISIQSYPGKKSVYYCYSNCGDLIAVRKSACNGPDSDDYWRGFSYNSHSQITMEKSGNSILTQYEYDLMGHVTGIHSRDKFKRTVRHWEYDFDVDGSMIHRKDLSPDRNTLETFSYDELDRIVRATMTFLDNKEQQAFTEDWQYNDIGNIVRYSGMGGLHHIYHPDKPGAVIMAGPNTYEYDLNGNVVRKNKQRIEWTSFNLPKLLQTKDEKNVSFTYDYDRARYMSVDANKAKTIYMGKVYKMTEIGDGDYVHKYFIYANGKLVAIETLKSNNKGKVNNAEIRYVHLDHLGSIDTVTDVNGLVSERLRYNAFGRRQPLRWAEYSQWNTYAQPGSKSLKRGFTGHEHIEDLDLIHMNGRVYDPAVGRFLSPDPHIQDPFDTQCFNRYSYAKNNPLRHNDPSGFFFKKIGRFFKKIFTPRVIFAVAASVITLGAATPWAAGIALSAGLTGTAAAVATGAIAGAASGFVGGTIITGSLKGGLKSAVAGGITGGVGGYFGSTWNVERIASQGVASGAANELTGGKFRDGFVMGAVTASMHYAYNKIVKYDVTWKPGGSAVEKQPWDMPTKGANNFGTAENTLDPSGWFNEGGRVSEALNRVPGINAVAGMHDVFQVKLDLVPIPFARDIFNVPGMLPAAAMTYAALLDGPTSAALIVDNRKSKRY